MRKKALGLLGALVVIVAMLPLFAAFEAHVVNVKAQIESALDVSPGHIDFGPVFPQETLEATFAVALSDSFLATSRTVDVEYELVQTLKPIPDTSPVVHYKDLRPFIYKSKDTSETDSDSETTAGLDQSLDDLVDNWKVELHVPCISSSQCKDHGTPACPTYPCGGPRHASCQIVDEDPPGSGGAGEWGADIWVQVTGISYPEQEIGWLDQFGTSGYDQGFGVDVDVDGNVYSVGFTQAAMPGQVHYGGLDVFLRKYQPNGAVLWTRQFGSPGEDYGFGVVSDADGNIFVAGQTWGTLPGQTSAGGADAFVTKYDSSGNELWVDQFGAPSTQDAFGVAVDPVGNVVVAGTTFEALPGQSALGSQDAFVRKYDSNGVELWTRQFGSAGEDHAYAVTSDAGGNIYVVGEVRGTLPGQASLGDRDAFVRKYDPDGAELWTRQFGSLDADSAMGAAGSTDGVFVAGHTDGQLSGQVSAGLQDGYIRKYDHNGVELWTRQFGSVGYDYVFGADTDANGNVYLSGDTGDALPGQTFVGLEDAYVRKYGPIGTELWTQQFGTSTLDYAWGTAAGPGGTVYTAGVSYGTLSDQTPLGGGDAFVAKFITE